MALLETRPRAGYTFLAVVIGHLVLISAQVTSKSGVPVLRNHHDGHAGEISGARPPPSVGCAAWSNYVALRAVRAENEALRNRGSRRCRSTTVTAAGAGRPHAQPQGDSQSAQQPRGGNDGARIIGAAASRNYAPSRSTRGSTHGIKVDMAVIAPGGVVGRVVVAGSMPSRDAADRGPQRRGGRAGPSSREPRGGGWRRRRPAAGSIRLADGRYRRVTLVTSGIDGIYPKGFVIGRVDSVQRVGAYPEHITISPAVDFSLIEDVLVVLTPTEAEQAESSQ